jgi:hypothetical protein
VWVEWELFAFLLLSAPSTSGGVGTFPGAAELPREVMEGEVTEVVLERGGEGEGREGREDTSLPRVPSSRRLWATRMLMSSLGGTTSSTSISAEDRWKGVAEARSEEGVGGSGAAFDDAGGRVEAAGVGGEGTGECEEGELIEESGS